ncbi:MULTISPECIES: hypothetical protein [Streptomyces]|uniref:Uncharacterized protein n=1 Tax=Streptomyces venezuelae TaxID=54571 RepID=A0A5P2AKJ3_STRVZ|nr:hypothetical protein [Streptomyces venezuelae]QES18713.1 hypothetical protein DEJ46_06115 [Streptomyces venezuelae]
MHDPTPYPIRLADSIADQLGQLNEHLAQASPQQAARILGQALDFDDGILGRITGLMSTGSRFAKAHSEQGTLPPEVWLAVGRAANELDAVGRDLDEHAGTLRALAEAPATTRTASPAPVASALVVRRRR